MKHLEFKECSSCHLDLIPETDFYCSSKGYYSSSCKKCTILRVKEYYEANKKSVREKQKEYMNQMSPEKRREHNVRRSKMIERDTRKIKSIGRRE